MRYVVRFLRFWYDFLVGDAWEIAAGVVAVMGIGAVLLSVQPTFATAFSLILAGAVALVLGVSVWLAWRKRRPRAGQESVPR